MIVRKQGESSVSIDFEGGFVESLEKNGGIGKVVSTYNEGAITDDIHMKEKKFRHWEPEYPSLGAYWMFPNMVSSQFMLYMCGKCGLYTGAHDENRGVKGIGFSRMVIRLLCSTGFSVA